MCSALTPPPGEVAALGVDWITATGQRGKRDLQLAVTAHSILDRAASPNAQVKTWMWQRYQGKSTEGISYGVREDGAILRLSGDQADTYWRDAVRNADRATRIDVQATVRFDPPDRAIAAAAYKQALAYNDDGHRQTEVRAIIHNGHVETLYLGSRKSPTFGRLYDKYAESEEARYADCWRYEVETKEEVANQLGRRLYRHDHPYRAISAYLFDWFSKRGVVPRFDRGTGEMRVSRTPPDDDDERRLKWLREQVGPVVAGLSARGRRGDALAAIGVQAEVNFTVQLERGA